MTRSSDAKKNIRKRILILERQFRSGNVKVGVSLNFEAATAASLTQKLRQIVANKHERDFLRGAKLRYKTGRALI